MRTNEGRDEFLGGFIQDLEWLHDVEPDLLKRDRIWQAIELAEEKMRQRQRHVLQSD